MAACLEEVMAVELTPEELAAKIAWSNDMRLLVSPKGMCHEDGSINQDFFKPEKVIIQLTEDKRWGVAEKDAMYKVKTCL
jgi:hypothetical protein